MTTKHVVATTALAATALATLAVPAPAEASLCSLAGVTGQVCTFATDTSGGQVIYKNPANLSNIGSGSIDPFLGTQHNGVEAGVNTDQTAVNLLPLDDKRDNANTFTETMRLSNLGFQTILGVDYFAFFLDINEPNNATDRFLSIDRLAIFGRTGAQAAAPLDLNSTNIHSLDDVDVFPNLSLVYRLGAANTLLLDGNLFAGSGLGYDMTLLVPTALFSGLVADSRIVFAVQYGGAGGTVAGADAQDGFEEWAFLPGRGPNISVPEPATIVLLAGALAAIAALRRRR